MSPNAVVVALLAAAVAVWLVALAHSPAADGGPRILLGALATTILGLGSLTLVGSLNGAGGGLPTFRLGPWAALWASLAFGLASLGWLGTPRGQAALVPRTAIVSALEIVDVALFFWTLGYLMGLPRRLSRLVQVMINAVAGSRTSGLRFEGAGIVLYSLGMLGRVAGVVLQGHLGYVGDPTGNVNRAAWYSQPLTMLSLFGLFGLSIVAWQCFRRPTVQGGFVLAVLLALEFAYGLSTGMKESVIMSFVAVLAAFGAVHGKFPVKTLAAILVLLVAFVAPVTASYRELLRSDGGYLTPTQALSSLPGVVRETVGASSLSASMDDILARVRLIDSVAIVVDRTPSTIPYRPLSELALAPALGLVPRAVWPSKPVLSTGYQFAVDYYGQSTKIYSSSAVTPVADLYRHGGWVVLIAGFLFLGAFTRALDLVVQVERDPRMLFLVVSLFPMFAKWEMDFVSLVAGTIVAFIGSALAARLAFGPTDPSR